MNDGDSVPINDCWICCNGDCLVLALPPTPCLHFVSFTHGCVYGCVCVWDNLYYIVVIDLKVSYSYIPIYASVIFIQCRKLFPSSQMHNFFSAGRLCGSIFVFICIFAYFSLDWAWMNLKLNILFCVWLACTATRRRPADPRAAKKWPLTEPFSIRFSGRQMEKVVRFVQQQTFANLRESFLPF